MKKFCLVALVLLRVAPASAQLVEPNQVGVRMGHVHLAVKDVDAQKQFWVGVMGGTLVKNGPLELIQFPGVYIMLRKAERPAPPAGSIVESLRLHGEGHAGRAGASGRQPNLKIEPTENPNEVYVHAPDGIRLEVYGEPALPTPVSMNHIHYNAPDIPGIKAWYVKALGANPGRRPCVGCISKTGDDRGGRPAGREPVVFAARGTPVVADKGTLARSHRLRRGQSRGVRQGARGEGESRSTRRSGRCRTRS